MNKCHCALLMMDSSTSAGWLRKNNFWEIIGKDVDSIQAKVQIETAGHHVTLFLEAGIKEYSQWFAGCENNVTNSLLHDFDQNDDKLT